MRLYDEKEIGAILKRTAELSKSARRENADGLSLEEIQALAAEAGLDPDLVAKAAGELSSPPVEAGKPDLWGGPLSHSIDLDFDFEIDADTWERMIPSIRRHYKDPGIVQTRKGVFEWTSSSSLETPSAHVSVQNQNGKSRINLFWNEVSSAIPFFIPTLLGFILSGILLFEEFAFGVEGIPIWIGITGLIFLFGRLGVMTYKKRGVRKIEEVAHSLRQVALEAEVSATKRMAVSQARTETIQTETSSVHGESAAVRLEVSSDEFGEEESTTKSVREREQPPKG